jgi:predicted dehydrogenase
MNIVIRTIHFQGLVILGMKNNIAIFGLGENFRKRYMDVCFPLHCKGIINIIAIIDLESQRDIINNYLTNLGITQVPVHYIPDRLVVQKPRVDDYCDWLSQLLGGENIQKVIISTEPKSHAIIAKWCLRKGIDIFMDKPVSAFYTLDDYSLLMKDYHDLEKLSCLHKRQVVVSCERRSHPGYHKFFDLIDREKNRTLERITYVDIHYGSGNRVTLEECRTKEHHPYKYGYGILLHSGHHYIDVLAHLIEKSFSPSDFSSLSFNFQVTFLPAFHKTMDSHLFGETSLMVQGMVTDHQDNKLLFSFKLLEETASLRNSDQLKDYKPVGYGRMRQENVIVHLGHQSSFYLRSLPFKKIDASEPSENFDIMVLRGGLDASHHSFECINRDDIEKNTPTVGGGNSLNNYARTKQLSDFLKGNPTDTPLSSHKLTVHLITQIYEKINKDRQCVNAPNLKAF